MSEDIQGFMHSPAEQIRNAFEKVAADTMHDLTFLHPSIPVYVTEPDAPAMAGRRALFTGKPVPRHA